MGRIVVRRTGSLARLSKEKKMKRINYILIMLFLVSSLLSCKHDANEENQNSTPIPDLTAIANFAKYSTLELVRFLNPTQEVQEIQKTIMDIR